MKKLLFCLFMFLASSFAANAQNIIVPQSTGTTIYGSQAGDYTGYSVVNLGDTDGDYYPNIAVSAERKYSWAGYGSVYILKGTPQGWPQNIDTATLEASGLGVTISGEIPGVYQGSLIGENVLNLGDLTGDRLNETLISARLEGAIYILNGSKTMPSLIKAYDIGSTVPGVKITGLAKDERYSVATGDFNGDGKKDIVIAQGTTGDVYYINSAKLPSTGIVTITPTFFDGIKGMWLSTPLNSGYSKNKVALADLTCDGKKDIVLTNPLTKVIYIVRGGALALTGKTLIDNTFITSGKGLTINTTTTLDAYASFNIGSVNGDLCEDILSRGDQITGKSDNFIIFGQSSWAATNNIASMIDGKKATRVTGLKSASIESITAAQGGDYNFDNIKDFIVGDPLFNTGRGRAVVVSGRSTWPATLDLTAPDGVKNIQIANPLVEFTGTSVEYAENLFGGIGCGTDMAYLIGSPVYGSGFGKVHGVSIKK